MPRTVVVAGGGISGLAACYYLVKNGNVPKVILLEGSSRLGGWLHSTRTDDGAVFEHGPRGIRPAGVVGKNTLTMEYHVPVMSSLTNGSLDYCNAIYLAQPVGGLKRLQVSDLGLDSEVLPVKGDHSASKNRYLYVKNALHKLPSGLWGVLKTTPPFTKPLALCGLKDLTARRGTLPDESIHDFVSRRFGQELADIAIDSLCRGVFAGDCRALSLRSCFPMLYEAEQKRGSVILGMALGGGKGPQQDSDIIRKAKEERWSQWSLRQGMQNLSEALADFLRRNGVEIHKNAPLTGLERTSDKSWKVKSPGGCVRADHLISAMPAKALSQVVSTSTEPLARELQQIDAVTVAVVNLEYDGAILPVTGFGHLVPSFEDAALLGIVYDSIAFPEQNREGALSTRLTVMLGGAWFEKGVGDPSQVSQEQLLARATEAVKNHLGVTAKPSRAIVNLHRDCIPQYTLGHWKRTENMFRYLEEEAVPMSLVGASYEGVSVNDCIYNARKAVERLLGPTPGP